MKIIYTLALTIFAAATFSSCNTTDSFDYPSPEYSRTSNELQEAHGKLLRQHY